MMDDIVDCYIFDSSFVSSVPQVINQSFNYSSLSMD